MGTFHNIKRLNKHFKIKVKYRQNGYYFQANFKSVSLLLTNPTALHFPYYDISCALSLQQPAPALLSTLTLQHTPTSGPFQLILSAQPFE